MVKVVCYHLHELLFSDVGRLRRFFCVGFPFLSLFLSLLLCSYVLDLAQFFQQFFSRVGVDPCHQGDQESCEGCCCYYYFYHSIIPSWRGCPLR